jgi:hypothetical protein
MALDLLKRAEKGSALSATEHDNNLTAIETEVNAKVDTTDASVTNAREWTAATVTQVDAEAGTGTTRVAWTVLRVWQAIRKALGGVSVSNTPTTGQVLTATSTSAAEWATPSGGGGATNLGYTASSTNGVVTSDTGTDATLPLSDGTNAGLLSPAQHAKLAGIGAGANVTSVAGKTGVVTLAAADVSGAASTASNLSQFASTTSAQLAGVISDETGSGALVFATSPTLVTPALGTPSSLVLTNATGLPNAAVIGLGTLATANAATPPALGTGTPAAGAFSVLTATTELTVPGAAPGTPDTLRYRDSTNAERLLLNAQDNLANLASAATARSNIGAAASGAVGSSGLTMTTARLLGRSTAGTGALEEITLPTGFDLNSGALRAPAEIGVAVSDETTALTAGTGKVSFRMPYAMTLTSVRLNVNTANTGSALIVNVKQGGATVFSTKPQIDAGSTTSVGSGTTPVISTSALTDNAVITVDIDQIGLKLWLIGRRA